VWASGACTGQSNSSSVHWTAAVNPKFKLDWLDDPLEQLRPTASLKCCMAAVVKSASSITDASSLVTSATASSSSSSRAMSVDFFVRLQVRHEAYCTQNVKPDDLSVKIDRKIFVWYCYRAWQPRELPNIKRLQYTALNTGLLCRRPLMMSGFIAGRSCFHTNAIPFIKHAVLASVSLIRNNNNSITVVSLVCKHDVAYRRDNGAELWAEWQMSDSDFRYQHSKMHAWSPTAVQLPSSTVILATTEMTDDIQFTSSSLQCCEVRNLLSSVA